MSRNSESGTQCIVPSAAPIRLFVGLSSLLKSVILCERGLLVLFIVRLKMELEMVKVDLAKVLVMLGGLGLNWGLAI